MRIRIPFAVSFLCQLPIAAWLGLAPSLNISNDKVLHFFVFFILTTNFYWIVDTTRRRVTHATALVCVLGAGVGSEFLQGLLPYRDFDYFDIAANVAGSGLALLLSSWYHKRMLERKRMAKYGAVPTTDDHENRDLELGETPSSGSLISQEEGVVSFDEETGVSDEPTTVPPTDTK
ncbi:putative VanZ domain protein [Saitoella complicata NRRL Y-17804]|uniref:putative VanZ domain protein n=1 Tax=Saitoella complicata (strain BCRC 22490 / CBS 7301 / JCM 7358 / NBRC 10748 / NRRL Y-17804) TaxID=698492 RepID=UPI00086715EB|nr:putative VanZ domain protein [Saitoella complicata NRRL Y-17804]ODQ56571.1 putative VanZ domain protein [Saitoella complicata NRRL Y-17804]